LKTIVKRNCINCSNNIIHHNVSSCVNLIVNREIEQINFDQLFQPSSLSFVCSVCNHQNHTLTETYKTRTSTKFIIVYLNTQNFSNGLARRTDCKIKKLNPSNVQLPGITNDSFKVISAICHLPSGSRNVGNAGHYVIWTRSRCKTGWLRISDSLSQYYELFVEDLKDITTLVLEKNS
jgi:hypothetical protein